MSKVVTEYRRDHLTRNIRKDNFSRDSQIEAVRKTNEIKVVVWYAVERGEYLEIFRECDQLTDEAWEFAKALAEKTSNTYNTRCNIVDLTKQRPGLMKRNWNNVQFPFVLGVLTLEDEFVKSYGIFYCNSFKEARGKVLIFSDVDALRIKEDEQYVIDRLENSEVVQSWYFDELGVEILI